MLANHLAGRLPAAGAAVADECRVPVLVLGQHPGGPLVLSESACRTALFGQGQAQVVAKDAVVAVARLVGEAGHQIDGGGCLREVAVRSGRAEQLVRQIDGDRVKHACVA